MKAAHLAVAGLLGALATIVTGAAPAAATPIGGCTPAGSTSAPDTWVDRMLEPEQAWPLTRGTGVVVAVLDAGVDAAQPQLAGRVQPGHDVYTGGNADSDCLGTGTAVAGAVAAAPKANGISGIAPGATILPVRVVADDALGTITASAVADGIDWATTHGADVIDVSVVLGSDSITLHDAVGRALAAGIPVVAAAGDAGSSANPMTYPAAIPGVIGVGAIGPDGAAAEQSEHGSQVAIMAPGAKLPALAVHRGTVSVDASTAVAAGYVSGTVALIRSRFPDLTPAQVSARLTGTATPAALGRGYGAGVVDPVLAVSSATGTGTSATGPALHPTRADAAEQVRLAAAAHRRDHALIATTAGLGGVLVIALLAAGLPRARRRAWHASYAPPPTDRDEPEEPAPVPMLFDG